MHLLLLALFQVTPGMAEGCPADATIHALKSADKGLTTWLQGPHDSPSDQAAQAEVLLACAADVPATIAARTFLLLGAHHFLAGDPTQVDRYYQAAFALEGADAWDDTLGGEDMEAWYQEVGAPGADKGVVFAPQALFNQEIHLVGTNGPPPWTMTVGTFTFQAGDDSVPVSVNTNSLSVITPRYLEEFHALVDGVSEADLDPPPIYDPPAHSTVLRNRRHRAQKGEPAPTTEPADPGSEAGSQDQPVVQSAAGTSSGTNNEPPPPVTPPANPYSYGYDEPLPTDDTATVAIAPHLDAGLSFSRGGAIAAAGSAPAGSFYGFGPQVGLGCAIRIGDKITLNPELGARFLGGASSALRDDSYTIDGQSPVEPVADTQLWFYGRVLGGPRFRHVSLGLGPTLARAAVRITDELPCSGAWSEGTCLATTAGSLNAWGGTVLVGVHPRWFPLFPRWEASVLGDGERLHVTTTLSVGWEGKP